MRLNDVVCIGSAAIDSVFLLKEFPLPDQISVAHWCKQFCGGSSANVAVGVARLGLAAGLVSKVGADKEGAQLLDALRSEGVDIEAVNISGKTARTVILLTERGDKTIIADTACVLKTGDEVPEAYVRNARALYIGDCFLPVAEKALDLAQKIGIPTFLRLRYVHVLPGYDLDAIISRADFVIMNEKTYAHIKSNHENIIITKGEKGCYYIKDNLTVEGFPVESVDTTGAGDAFCAGFISSMLRGGPVDTALQGANAAGAVAATRYGAMKSMPSKKEVESLLEVQ